MANLEIAVDEAIHMHNETPTGDSTPAEAYNPESTTSNAIREETDRAVRLTGGPN